MGPNGACNFYNQGSQESVCVCVCAAVSCNLNIAVTRCTAGWLLAIKLHLPGGSYLGYRHG